MNDTFLFYRINVKKRFHETTVGAFVLILRTLDRNVERKAQEGQTVGS